MTSLVYFSSASENTHRFVQRLGLPATRIPLHDRDGTFEVDEPYVLILPTYGGGTTVTGRDTSYVPKPVIRFLNNKHNRSLIRGVIAAGNTNFGESYCYAGNVISQKCRVPYLYRFELMGTAEDVACVREGLAQFWEQANRQQPEQAQSGSKHSGTDNHRRGPGGERGSRRPVRRIDQGSRLSRVERDAEPVRPDR